MILAYVSSRNLNKSRRESQRWSEIRIERSGEYFAVTEIGKSLLPGEVDIERRHVCADGAAAVAALERNGKLTALATDALQQAAENDREFAITLGDRHDVEDLIPLSPAVSLQVPANALVYVLERDGERALRVIGSRLAHASSQDEQRLAWTTVDVYGAVDGRYVVHRCMRTRSESVPVRASAFIVRDAIEAASALLRRGKRHLESVSRGALEKACSKDARFYGRAAAKGSRLSVAEFQAILDELAHSQPIGRTRYRVLKELLIGARLHATSIDGKPVHVAWDDPPGVAAALTMSRESVPDRDLFLALSRERLIRPASALSDDVWEISISGYHAADGRYDGMKDEITHAITRHVKYAVQEAAALGIITGYVHEALLGLAQRCVSNDVAAPAIAAAVVRGANDGARLVPDGERIATAAAAAAARAVREQHPNEEMFSGVLLAIQEADSGRVDGTR